MNTHIITYLYKSSLRTLLSAKNKKARRTGRIYIQCSMCQKKNTDPHTKQIYSILVNVLTNLGK